MQQRTGVTTFREVRVGEHFRWLEGPDPDTICRKVDPTQFVWRHDESSLHGVFRWGLDNKVEIVE